MGLPAIAAPCARDLAARGSPEEDRGRSILADLLAPIDRDAAGLWAERLIAEFGTLAAVLAAPRGRLLRLLDESAVATACIETNRRAMHFALRHRLEAGPVIASDRELHDYLWFTMAHERVETVHCLFLGAANQLLRDELLSTGTQSEALIAPRDIVYRALELQATGIILVHNHPSGDPTPSAADIAATRALVRAASPLGITVHDHMIIGATGHASLRGRRLI